MFVACNLGDLVPEDYILRRVDRILDLSWFREEVAPKYSSGMGRHAIDPESALRLMLAGFFLGIVHDRQLMREASLHIGIRWFVGFELHEKLPDHSSLSRLRTRWGADLFEKVFQHTVQQCIDAGLVGGKTVHVDATVVAANCDWASVASRHARRVLESNAKEVEEKGRQSPPADKPPQSRSGEQCPDASPEKKSDEAQPAKRVSSDPDASLVAGGPRRHLMPGYKQHKAVDTAAGVVLDCEVTTGGFNEGHALLGQIDRVTQLLGSSPACVTADCAYDHPANYRELIDRGIDPVIPPRKKGGRPPKVFSISDFKYDARHDLVRCPAGRRLHRRNPDNAVNPQYRAPVHECAKCPLRQACLNKGQSSRMVQIVPDFVYLVRARRRHARRLPPDVETYRRHRWRAEGSHGEAKTKHNLRRAQRRGLANMRIQSYLCSAVMNLKRRAMALLKLIFAMLGIVRNVMGLPTPKAHQLTRPATT